MDLGPIVVMVNKFINYIRMLNRENVNFSNWSFQILWLISSMDVKKKIQNFSSISLKLCLLGQQTRNMGCNTTISTGLPVVLSGPEDELV